MKYDADFFDGKCPYTGKPCYDWECEICEVDAEEKKSMEELDKAEGEEKEKETWNGLHAQISSPKGTFEQIFNDADDDNDI